MRSISDYMQRRNHSLAVCLSTYVHVLKYKSIYSFTITHILSCYTRCLHHRALIGRPLALSDNKDIPPASAEDIYIPNVDEIACMHACKHAWMYECMYVCMHACMSVCLSDCLSRSGVGTRLPASTCALPAASLGCWDCGKIISRNPLHQYRSWLIN